MKLYMHPASPYSRKARIIIRELDLTRLVEEIVVVPTESEELRRINPLGKIPVLVLKDGSTIIDSPVICEYLNDLGSGRFFPGTSVWREVSARWRARTLEALGDGICDAAVARVYEGRRPPENRHEPTIQKYLAVVTRSLDTLEHARFTEEPTIGEIAVACALGYVDFRDVIPGWRDSRPKLAAWFEKFAEYPSMKATWPESA